MANPAQQMALKDPHQAHLRDHFIRATNRIWDNIKKIEDPKIRLEVAQQQLREAEAHIEAALRHAAERRNKE
jgi:hypothetical protein